MAKGSAVTDEVINILVIAALFYGTKWLVDSGTLEQAFVRLREVGKNIKLPNFGGGSSGPYKLTGRKCNGSSVSQQISCSGGSATSKRVNFNNCGFQSHQVTAIIQFGGGCTSSCGDEATIKHGGPTHSDGNCCWAISVVRQNGQCSFGGEGPHPDTDLSQGNVGSVGNLQGKRVGIKSIFIKTAGGAHQELWVDPSGGNNFKKMGARDLSSWGNSRKSNKVASPQQVELRCDCSQAQWLSYEVAELA